MLRVTANDVKQFVFGCSDGLTSAIGVVLPLALAHRSMLSVILGLATCSALGMGGGLYLSDNDDGLRPAMAMAAASFAGSVIPAAPFFFTSNYAVAVTLAVILTGATLVAISEVKAQDMSRWKAYAQTFGILAVASVSTVAFALATGASG